jgi:formiminoglutamate deiminase
MDHAAVDKRWCCVHATHMDDAEARDLAATGAVAGLCPITEANLGDGVFNTATFLAARGNFGVGSDSNVEIGVAVELKQLEYAQRLAARQRNVLAPLGGSTGRALLEGAAAGGAQALQRETGRLAAGAYADIVSLDTNSPFLIGREGDQILDAWIFCAGSRAVDCVWSAGRMLVTRGRHFLREEIGAKFAAAMRALISR